MSVTKNYKEMIKAADIDGLIRWYRQVFVNKYYDMYMNQIKVDGLDYQPYYYMMGQLWQKGTQMS